MISNGVASLHYKFRSYRKQQIISGRFISDAMGQETVNDADSKLIYGRGNTGVFSTDPNVKPLAKDSTFIASLVTKPLIAENQDFILKGSFSVNVYNTEYSGPPEYYFGLTAADTVPELANQASPLIRMVYTDYAIRWRCQLNKSDLGYATYNYDAATQGNFSFIRKGNTLFSSVTLNTGTFTEIGTITQKALKFGMFLSEQQLQDRCIGSPAGTIIL